MAAASDPLAELRDIHLPEPVSWWPPAPGWWLVAAVCGIAVILVAWFLRRRRRRAPLDAALAELERARQRFAEAADTCLLAADLSMLVRRVALAHFPRREVASLSGQAWLAFLDGSGATRAFSNGPGRALARAPYHPGEDYDPGELIDLVESWIKRAAARGAAAK